MLTREFQSVLFVDDDADICSVVQATLRLVPGLNVRTADSGERAIDLAYELRPDLVLMDVMMPGLDGPSTFKRMRESVLLAQIPVIFMTAKVLPAEISRFLRLGAIGVIVKPFDPLELYGDLVALWSKGGAVQPNSAAPGGPSQAEAQAQAQVDSLTINFLRRASADIINLAKMIAQAQDGERSVFKEIERVSHSIHGAGAMFGFPRMSDVSGTMTRIAEQLTASAAPVRAVLLQQLLESSKQLAREVDGAWQTAPQGGAMFQGPAASK